MAERDPQTDNSHLPSKLELRRYFLRAYHNNTPAHTPNHHQNNNRLWSVLRSEFEIATYWGVDVKPKAGRLQLDSSQVIGQAGWKENVVDIDTYGAPWQHWRAMLPHVTQATTVFLTIGRNRFGMDRSSWEALGLMGLRVPKSIMARLAPLAVEYQLAKATEHGLQIAEAIEAFPSRSARYIGVRLVPIAAKVSRPKTKGKQRRRKKP